MMSLLWGLGGSYELEQRKKLEELIKDIKGSQLPQLKDQDSYYDFHLQLTDKGLEWKLIIPEKWKVPSTIYFSRLLLPTIESTKAQILIDLLMANNNPCLLIGSSGTAKTSSILMYAQRFNPDERLFHRINFSSAT